MQRTVDNIKERAKYLRDMLTEHADDESLWMDNDEDMAHFIDEPKQEVVNKAIMPYQDTTHEEAQITATHPLVTGYQDNTVTSADLEKKKNDDKIGNIVNNLGEKTLIETMNNLNKFLSNEIT